MVFSEHLDFSLVIYNDYCLFLFKEREWTAMELARPYEKGFFQAAFFIRN